MHTYIRTCIYKLSKLHIFVETNVTIHADIHTYINTCTYTHTHACTTPRDIEQIFATTYTYIEPYIY